MFWQHLYLCSLLDLWSRGLSVLALLWAPLEVACAAFLGLASQFYPFPFPAWRPTAAWTLSCTHSFLPLYGAVSDGYGGLLGDWSTPDITQFRTGLLFLLET